MKQYTSTVNLVQTHGIISSAIYRLIFWLYGNCAQFLVQTKWRIILWFVEIDLWKLKFSQKQFNFEFIYSTEQFVTMYIQVQTILITHQKLSMCSINPFLVRNNLFSTFPLYYSLNADCADMACINHRETIQSYRYVLSIHLPLTSAIVFNVNKYHSAIRI